jgi:hypothetical protein
MNSRFAARWSRARNSRCPRLSVPSAAHREEPYFLPFLPGDLLTAPSLYFFGSEFGRAYRLEPAMHQIGREAVAKARL